MAEERHGQQEFPYHEARYNSGVLAYEIFAAGYNVVSQSITHPSSRIDYIYSGGSLIGETVTTRDEDGNVKSVVSYEWYTEKSGKTEIRRKVRV